MQLKIKNCNDIIVEWIPYNQLNEIKKVGKNDSAPLYSAIWTDGSLKYNYNKIEQKKISNKEVTLKYLVNSQNNITNEFLNKIKSYFVEYDNIIKIYGISQNPDTKKYIIVLENGKHCEICNEIYTDLSYKWCKLCQINNLKTNFINWTSSNEKIIELIQEMRLKIRNYDDIVVEWIPYNQLNDIKEIDKDDYSIICSAIWTDGPLKYNYDKIERIRMPNKKVALKYLVDSNNIINEFLNEAKSYTIENDDHSNIITIYGISQDIDTKGYIMVLQDCYCENCGKIYTGKRYKWCNPCQINNLKQNFASWTSGNEKVDKFIQKAQLKIDKLDDAIFEWIPYNQFDYIKEMGTTLYSAIWMNGPLCYNYDKMEWKRNPNEKINLIFYDNSFKLTNDEFLKEDNSSLFESDDFDIKIYGVSQISETKNYILILQDCYCEYFAETHEIAAM
ncbi:hypothetical protein RirG_016550 [Rhizophagus irregularis DAOM 197198w]|uniref:Protein kinase domain-containing protein n=2 Tax=Rhizophagus irregularis TaxID=588596 RepID=A0A015LF14_RHIIW|nr:hypothetical protein RirG_016550 [Rhizophagus irregularis DAOM 197198w]